MGDAVDNGPAALGADNPAALGANNSAAKGADDPASKSADNPMVPSTNNAATLDPAVSPTVAVTLGADVRSDKATGDKGAVGSQRLR